jgi:glutaredoxin 3
MTDFLIYTIPICPYCVKAKELLKSKDFIFEEIIFAERESDNRLKQIEDLFEKANGMRTFPQIFDIRESGVEKHIGGYTDLQKKCDNGEI